MRNALSHDFFAFGWRRWYWRSQHTETCVVEG